ncbi:MAG: HAAS signaling domain-containing protein [Beutenbergiaceae bacterium]
MNAANSSITLADRWRRWIFLQRLEVWLEPLGGKRRRAVLRDLKDSLADAADDSDMVSAIEDLGTPRSLARRYIDGEPKAGPTWFYGAIIASLAFAFFLYLGMGYSAGMLDALDSSGASSATGSFFGLRLDAFKTDSALGVEVSDFPWSILGFIVLAWVLGSRLWRLVPGRQRQTTG